MMRKRSKMLKMLAMALVLFLVVPVQTIWAASGKVTTKVKHKPSNDEYIPGFRIQLDAQIKDKAGLLATRCYFKAKKDKVFTFVNMNNIEDNEYRAILPAPWVNSEFIEYLFVTVNKPKQITRTQMFKIEEAETKEAAQWQEAGEAKELRIDKVQEVVEEYEELRKEIREKYHKKRAKYQIESQDVITVLTEVDESLVSLNGFYDGITVSQVPAATQYGVLTEGIYTTEQIATAGGATAVSSTTGAASAGTIEAATGMSTAGVVGIGLGAAVVLGGAAAAGVALSNSDDDSSSVDPNVPVDVGDATAQHFVGTYSNRDPNRSTSQWRAVTTLNEGGSGSWQEWHSGQHNTGNLQWSWDQSASQMTINYLTGAVFSGRVSGNTHNFTLSGRWSSGASGTVIFTRQ